MLSPEEGDPELRIFEQLTKELDKRGVLFLENFWCCSRCGHSAAGNHRTGPHQFGYVFYHGQDTEGAKRSGSLILAFGSFKDNDDDEIAVQVGQTFVETATELGFNVEWNGDPNTRLHMSDLPQEYFEDLPYGEGGGGVEEEDD